MRRCEVLTKLRQYIFTNKVVKGMYIDINVEDEPRYCPIGFILKQLGISDLDLIYLTESYINTIPIPTTPKIKDILSGNVNLPNEIVGKIKSALFYIGFTEEELTKIEETNHGVIHEELYITIYDLMNQDCICDLKLT